MCQLIGQNIIHVQRTASSNNYAISQVHENEVKEGTVFLAYEQTSGKGQLTNKWESEAGKNLTFSIVLYPEFLDIRQQFMLSKIICLGIETFLSNIVEGVRIKWPNDIYVEDKKICGILIENSVMNGIITQSVVGIGLNVNQLQFFSDAPNPVSLAQITNKTYDLDDVLNGVLQGIDTFYKSLLAENFQNLDEAFCKRLFQLNQLCWYQDERHKYQGTIIGVNEIGQLQIQEQNGDLNEYHFKEVSYLK
ncbi:biotin--[acetyl-CoA-carboxylase] ligase [Sunxiuqinia sp. A32]|uniref:biotin--[acetyl-CoA-carboxylase] ligase n=1 Tax=Sunxiuqinia sp. A32 TaxID=3461496 RepID=UPI004045E862